MQNTGERAAEKADNKGGGNGKPRVYARTNQQPEDHTAGDDRPLHGEVGKIKNGIGDVVPHREDRIHKAIL